MLKLRILRYEGVVAMHRLCRKNDNGEKMIGSRVEREMVTGKKNEKKDMYEYT